MSHSRLTQRAPTEIQAASEEPMFEQVVTWTKAMEYVRNGDLIQA